MSKRDGLPLLLLIAALGLTAWAVRSTAAISEPGPSTRPAPPPRCSQALASTNGVPAAKRSGRAAEPLCSTALRRRAA